MWRLACLLSFCIPAFNCVGQTYFQQEVNCRIDVRLNDREHKLEANIEIEYINHSPEVLDSLYFHHWPNAYRNTETALARQMVKQGDFAFQYAPLNKSGAISGMNYEVNGIPIGFDHEQLPADIYKLGLPSPLLPGDTAHITTPFVVEIPDASFSRLGHDGEAYYITQWFPKPAVFDHNGWHPMSYLNQGEFYSEYGNYTVNITIPENYVVMATGQLQTPEELSWLEKKAELTRQTRSFGSSMDFPPSSQKFKTITYRQDRIHDFAWFADKRYHVLKDQTTLPGSGDTIITWAAFTNSQAEWWLKSTEYLAAAVKHYSQYCGDYPYPQITAVDGVISAGSGMEYPMITVVGESGSELELETVIVHEAGHNWFYGTLGSNERAHPWMDEGLNSAYEQRYLSEKYPHLHITGKEKIPEIFNYFGAGDLKLKDQNQLIYLFNARRNLDQAPSLSSERFTSLNYGAMVYGKTALVFEYLRAYAGDEKYDRFMQKYASDWQFKHPGPEDLWPYIAEMLDHGPDSWIYQLIHSTRKMDYKAASLKKHGKGYNLKITSPGKIKGPVGYTLLSKEDHVIDQQWIAPFRKDTVVFLNDKKFHRAVIDYNRVTPEINRKNNTIRRRGIIRKTEPLRLQLFAGLENPARNTLYFSPLIGFNSTDRLMAGLLFHNITPLQKRIEFRLSPMWGFGTDRFNWMGALRHNFRFHESSWIENLWGEFSSASFGISMGGDGGYFEKYQLSAQLDIKRYPLNRNLSHHVFWSLTRINEQFGAQEGTALPALDQNLYGLVVYSIRNSLPLRPYSLNIGFDLHQDFDRLWIELNNRFVMNRIGRAFETRLFAGQFQHNETLNARYNFRMDGIRGPQDFRYDHIYVGRFDANGIGNQQFNHGHGNFKIPTANGQSNEWLIALNFKLESPVKIPIGLYADIGFSAFRAAGSLGFLFNAGVYIWLVPNAVEIYFPMVWTNEIQAEIDVRNLNYPELIRFVVNFNEINPFNLIKRVKP